MNNVGRDEGDVPNTVDCSRRARPSARARIEQDGSRAGLALVLLAVLPCEGVVHGHVPVRLQPVRQPHLQPLFMVAPVRGCLPIVAQVTARGDGARPRRSAKR